MISGNPDDTSVHHDPADHDPADDDPADHDPVDDDPVDDDAFDWHWTHEGSDWVPPVVDHGRVSAARVYDYFLDGKDNFAVDRAAAARLEQIVPDIKPLAQANRAFLSEAVRVMARDHGIRQFIDLGTGIPTSPTVHEVAKDAQSGARVVYLDANPVVLAHARAILATEPGTVTLLHDLRDPTAVLDDPQVRAQIDFDQPVGLLFVAVLHFVAIDLAPTILAKYCSTAAPGSCIAISVLCRDGSEPDALQVAEHMYQDSDATLYARTRAQVEQLFEGWAVAQPGIVDVTHWSKPGGTGWSRPGGGPIALSVLAGVGVKS